MNLPEQAIQAVANIDPAGNLNVLNSPQLLADPTHIADVPGNDLQGITNLVSGAAGPLRAALNDAANRATATVANVTHVAANAASNAVATAAVTAAHAATTAIQAITPAMTADPNLAAEMVGPVLRKPAGR